ncbi:MAG: response regulator [Marinoscillum sp.]
MERLTCIAIDDDPLFLRTMKVYLEQIEWIDLQNTYINPVHGAKGILQLKPALILTDQEMPLVDGNYLIDWIRPHIDKMKKRPFVILISAVDQPPQSLMDNIDGFVRKSSVLSADTLAEQLKRIISR